jgi:hypothetical protein
LLRSHFSNASAKTCYAPATTQANIVLPAFARSFPADEGGVDARNQEVRAKKETIVKIQEVKGQEARFRITQNGIYRNINTITNPKTKAGKGLTKKRAWEYGLWGEAFFCLGFLVTFGPSQK